MAAPDSEDDVAEPQPAAMPVESAEAAAADSAETATQPHAAAPVDAMQSDEAKASDAADGSKEKSANEGRKARRSSSSGSESESGRDESRRSAGRQPPPVLTQRELLERVARAKALGRQQLGELTREHREIEQRLRQLEATARMRTGERRDGDGGDGKRDRDEPMTPTGEGRAAKAQRAQADKGLHEGAESGGDDGKTRKAARTSESKPEDWDDAGESAEGEGDTSSKAAAASGRPTEPPADADGIGDAGNGDEESGSRKSGAEDVGGNTSGQAAGRGRSGDMEVDAGDDGDAAADAPAEDRDERPRQRGPPPPPPRTVPSPRVRPQDEGSKQRNRKMFGVLLGTLHRARDEQGSTRIAKTLALQQQKLEKVDAKLRSDREKLLEYQRSFVSARRSTEINKRDAIRAQRSALDERLLRLTWDSHELALSAFIHTETGPPIYYMPRKHNDATRARLREQQLATRKHLADSPIMLTDPLALPPAASGTAAEEAAAPMEELAPTAAPDDEPAAAVSEAVEEPFAIDEPLPEGPLADLA